MLSKYRTQLIEDPQQHVILELGARDHGRMGVQLFVDGVLVLRLEGCPQSIFTLVDRGGLLHRSILGKGLTS